MSDETKNPETGETEEVDGAVAEGTVEEGAEDEGKKDGPQIGGGKKGSQLSRPTDFVARPGFRNPANLRSKASKKKQRKK